MDARKTARGLSLAAILPGLCRDRGWQAQVEVYSLLARWSEVVDAETAAHSRPDKITAGLLWVEVENPVWMQQFQYRRGAILDTLNARLRHAKIDEIRFRLPGKKIAAQSAPEPSAIRFLPPDPVDLQTFTQLATTVKDPACRRALINFWYLAHACQKDEES